MSISRSLFLLTLACFLNILGGCASAPPAGSHPQNGVSSDGTDEHDGWLFNSLTGRGKVTNANQAAAPTPPATNPPVRAAVRRSFGRAAGVGVDTAA